MSKIISIATGLPEHKYSQSDLFSFADKVYSNDQLESRKLKYLYNHSGISERYSVVPDFTCQKEERLFFPSSEDLEPFPSIEKRMQIFEKYAAGLSVKTIEDCIAGKINKDEITHLITVSCTGISAPGLDLQVMEIMGLARQLTRTSVNFMGCYAAIHAMKLADAFCSQQKGAKVIIVCTELCTLHFQKTLSADNITSSLLFGDGCAAILVQGDDAKEKGIRIKSFYADVALKGKQDMAWQLSSHGFLMTLTGYVPGLLKEDFDALTKDALHHAGVQTNDITHWCVHPGGRKILEAISSSLNLASDALQHSYDVLRDYGNMSSATILFVLQKILQECALSEKKDQLIFGAAFGPGLTMETFTATYD